MFSGGDGSVDIVDVTIHAAMSLMGTVSYADASYTHQGWISDDRNYLYVNDELDGIQRTLIFNVSDLNNPFFVDEFTTGLSSVDHNLYYRDGFIFEANYTSGLRIFDACDPESPVEVGFFDTFPPNNGNGFSGAWSNYPFFPSGTVIVSDRSGGLFVLDVTDALAASDCCPEDCSNSDGIVGTRDLLALLAQWGTAGPCDIDGGGVSTSDLLALLAAWGACP